MIEALQSWLIECSILGAPVIAAVLLLRPLARRCLGADAAHLLWVAVLVRFLCPWTPESPLGFRVPQSLSSESSLRLSVRVVDTTESRKSIPAGMLRPEAISFPWWGLVYVAGVVGMAALTFYQALRARNLLLGAREITRDASIRESLARLCYRFEPAVLVTNELRSPALTGLLRPKILLPEDWKSRFTPEQLGCVFLHESGHWRRGDQWWQWGFLLTRIVHWFNPLLWIAERVSRADRELACDEWAITRSRSADFVIYGETLLRAVSTSSRPSSPSLTPMARSARSLALRLRQLRFHRPRPRGAIFAILGAVVFALVLLGSSNGEEASTVAEAGRTTPPLSAGETATPSILRRSGGSVEIEVKVVEWVDKKAPKELRKIQGELKETVSKVVSSQNLFPAFEALNKIEGVDLVSAPRVTSRSGQRAIIEIIREFRYPTEFELPEIHTMEGRNRKVVTPPTPTAFETRNAGLAIEVLPSITLDGRIDLEVTPSMTEFVGFVNYSPSTTQVINQPIFETRKVMTDVTLASGESVIIGGISVETHTDPTRPLLERIGNPKLANSGFNEAGESTRRSLLVFLSATIVPDRSPPAAQPEAAVGTDAVAPSADSNSSLPRGIPVPGKAGFVTSPHSPRAGYVDLRGFTPGTEVKCPYTGKPFVAP